MGTRSPQAAHNGEKIGAAINPTQHSNNATCSNDNPITVGILGNAASRLRALGPHPALPAVLRRMAKEWVRKWAASVTLAGSSTVPAGSHFVGGSREVEAGGGRGRPSEDLGGLAQNNTDCLAYLGNAAKCLAEARSVLSTIVASAEPVGDALVSVPATSKDNDQKPTAENGTDDEVVSTKTAGKKGKAAETAQPPGDADPAAGSSGTGRADSSLGPPAVISTPLGRALVMVQLEEACVRVMMGRFGDEARSKTQGVKAAAIEEGVTPVQRCNICDRPGRSSPTPG